MLMNIISNILSCVITVLPALFGMAKWNSLPDRMAIHFGIDGTPNGYAPKIIVVVLLPLFLLAIQILCLVALKHPKKEISQLTAIINTWVVPVVSIIVSVAIYRFALK